MLVIFREYGPKPTTIEQQEIPAEEVEAIITGQAALPIKSAPGGRWALVQYVSVGPGVMRIDCRRVGTT